VYPLRVTPVCTLSFTATLLSIADGGIFLRCPNLCVERQILKEVIILMGHYHGYPSLSTPVVSLNFAGIRMRREFCGRPDHHPYELFLQLEGIEHRTTKVRRPQSNGFIERLHRTLLDEHFRIKGRTTWYESVEQMQTDLDSYLEHYNTQRPHQGRMMEGQTPYSMFKKGLKLIPKEVRTKVA
jgi:hypothetical protein